WRPRGLEGQRHERVRHRLARRHLHDRAAAARRDFELEAIQITGVIDPVFLEYFGRRQSNLEPLELVRSRDQPDLRLKWLVQCGLELDVTEPERVCSEGSGQ